MLRRLIVASILAVAIVDAGQVFAQAAFPAPLPGQAEAPASNASPVPHANGAAPSASPGVSAAFPSGSRADACMNEFAPLREEAQERGRLIKAASDRKAPADEACMLIVSFGQAEIKMIKYIETNSAKCGIPPRIADQLRSGHKNTEKMQKQVCAGAQLAQASGPNSVPGDATRRVPAGPVGDFGHWINRQVP
ncbi:hypothetical protein [Bradyrhizobium sp. McL0615]|uniref:hypothetical protein n=1 Tax=Bradyrhizobium sp. McL0615 TaxID=3415673 RepID=UPI003CF8659D